MPVSRQRSHGQPARENRYMARATLGRTLKRLQVWLPPNQSPPPHVAPPPPSSLPGETCQQAINDEKATGRGGKKRKAHDTQSGCFILKKEHV